MKAQMEISVRNNDNNFSLFSIYAKLLECCSLSPSLTATLAAKYFQT